MFLHVMTRQNKNNIMLQFFLEVLDIVIFNICMTWKN